MKSAVLFLAFLLPFSFLSAQPKAPNLDKAIDAVEQKVIEWRRHFHQNPELSNREFETAKKIAAHLKSLGIDVQENVAKTGVVGILKGAKPGPVVALRADMDALPVKERVDLPFSSKAKGVYNGAEVDVMHACGHDSHVAMLMGVAEIFAQNKSALRGTIKFIFQPAEEGAPEDETGGASLMVAEGVLENPKVDVIFGLHINAQTEVGVIRYKPEGTMAAADRFKIHVQGKQTHGSTPWTGNDPIVVSAQIIQALQTIISRQTELTKEAAVITVGIIHSGVRNNIIPEEAHLEGTIRTLNSEMRDILLEKMERTVKLTAEAAGAKATLQVFPQTPVTYNDPKLTEKMLPTLQRTAGKTNVHLVPAITGAEDFAFYQQKVPGLFVFVGGMTPDTDPATTGPHHTPDFRLDENGFKLGVKTLVNLTLDFMYGK